MQNKLSFQVRPLKVNPRHPGAIAIEAGDLRRLGEVSGVL